MAHVETDILLRASGLFGGMMLSKGTSSERRKFIVAVRNFILGASFAGVFVRFFGEYERKATLQES
jgi:uncharacterized membrane protein YoaK (UPF0700 family)